MAKGKKKPIKKDESESEDDDLEFDKLSKKDMYKIMKLMKKIEEQELQLENKNDNLVREVEKLKNELRVLRGKGHVQPSQDNRDDMVKKLEKGSTVTCTKSPINKLKKIHDKSDKQIFKKKAQVMYLECSSIGHFASKCPSKKIDQTSLSRRQRRLSQRKCFGCMEGGHKIASCPKKGKGVLTSQNRMFRFDKPEVPVSAEKPQVIERCGKGFMSAYDSYMGKCGSTRRQIKDKERRIKYRICYTCRTKGHIGKDCPKAQVSIPKLVNIDSLTMKATNDPCANMENRKFRFGKPEVPVSPGKSEEQEKSVVGLSGMRSDYPVKIMECQRSTSETPHRILR
ncbi:hypothetical protein EJB05_46967, partial [Eragrostis curvula]